MPASESAASDSRPANVSAKPSTLPATWSIRGMTCPPSLVASLISGVANPSPNRLSAALTLPTMPSKLSPADWAAPPMCSRIAASKSANDTLPAETISCAAAVVMP